MGRNVGYFYAPGEQSYYFSPCHPMEPVRVDMTHELVKNYNLFDSLSVFIYDKATENQLKAIHSPEYIDYIRNFTPSTINKNYNTNKRTHSLDEDCPLFKGVYDYMSSTVGGSLLCAKNINQGTSDICINWAGGMHHAKKASASGFCFANDIVACIIDLLRYHQRVLYIDIDVHHGDGVEQFFYESNRVMTLSFHQYGDFFPATGETKESGSGIGTNYSINVPLKRGINDQDYETIFNKIVFECINRYNPEVIVLQMGADSVAGDRLGGFNLSNKGHSQCLNYIKSFNLPLVVLGGGGYTTQNVARTWTLETGVALGVELEDMLPENSFIGTDGWKANLEIKANENIANLNTKKDINDTIQQVMEVLKRAEITPSIQLQNIPKDWYNIDVDSDEIEIDPKTEYAPHFNSDNHSLAHNHSRNESYDSSPAKKSKTYFEWS
ncbi:histone deacetylase clr6 [Neoconidiobolus thromboides FSU 785]|nr:histone deacetylase clr6 [Neoconidiobolus thromboides FSU 785]KAI9292978.1 histone deacetylase clr6 [Neoconidiobolus thromboides FSU 785]